MNSKKSNKGLTLLEVLAVMAVLAVMVTLSYFSFLRMLRTERIKGAVFQLKSDILLERQEALAKGEIRGLTPDSTDFNQYIIITLDSLPAFFTQLRSIKLPSNVRFGHPWGYENMAGMGIDYTTLPGDGFFAVSLKSFAPSSADNYLLFQSNGTLFWADVYYIYLTNGHKLFGLRINKWGNVRTYEYKQGEWYELR